MVDMIDDYFVDEDSHDDSFSERQDLIRALKAKEVVLSHSSFNAFCNSPRHFVNYKLKKFEPTPSMLFGTIIHCSILQPDLFDDKYIVAPPCDKRTKEGKEIWANFLPSVGNKKIVSDKDYNTAMIIGDSIRKSDVASNLLENCVAFEVPIEWEYSGFKWKGIMDGDGRKNGFIMDLKVLADVSPRKVANYVKYEGAGRQAVHYLRGGKADNCDYYVLAVDRFGNYSVSVIGKGLINQLSREIDWYLSRFKSCIFTGDWHSSYDFYGNQNGHFEINSL